MRSTFNRHNTEERMQKKNKLETEAVIDRADGAPVNEKQYLYRSTQIQLIQSRSAASDSASASTISKRIFELWSRAADANIMHFMCISNNKSRHSQFGWQRPTKIRRKKIKHIHKSFQSITICLL